MYKLLVLLLLLSFSGVSFAEIRTIDGPTSICPQEEAKFTVTYTFTYNLYGYPREIVAFVEWDFIQNNKVIKTLKSANFSTVTPGPYIGSAEIIINKITTSGGLQNAVPISFGELTVRVRIFTIFYTGFASVPVEYKKSKNIIVGLSKPIISGPNNICIGGAATYSTSPISNASSYTWEVPMGWFVNGIPGPIVPNQGSSVIITLCDNRLRVSSEDYCNLTAFSTHSIKVKGISSNCGESNYAIKNVTIDYPFTISQLDISETQARLIVSPYNFPQYHWTLPPEWTLISNGGYYVDFFHNGYSGSASIVAQTYCWSHQKSYYFSPAFSENCSTAAYPNPAKSELTIDPCLNQLSSISLEVNGQYKKIEFEQTDKLYKLDVSKLKHGVHFLKIVNAHGKAEMVRFFKD